jgi:Arc/MetJ-type ribon-helix-helix transcriptional regulator
MEHTITLPEDLYSEIEALAHEGNTTTVDVIRSAVRRVTEHMNDGRTYSPTGMSALSRWELENPISSD